MKIKNSISSLITVILTSVVVVVSSLFILYSYFSMVQKNSADLEKRADEYIEVLANGLAVPVWNFDRRTVVSMISAFSLNDQVVGLSVKDPYNNDFLTTQKNHLGNVVTRTRDIVFQGEYAGNVTVTLSSGIYETLNRRMLVSHIVIILIVVAFLIFSTNSILRFYLKRPLKRLNTLARAYAEGNYDYPASEEPYVEFRRFTETMKEMGNKILSQMTTIKNAEIKFRNMFENANEGIFQISAKWKEISVNPALAKILGYDSPQSVIKAIQLPDFEVFETKGEFQAVINQLRVTGPIKNLEKKIRRTDGKQGWVLISGRAVFTEGQSLAYYEGTVVDITILKTAKDELESLKQYLKSVVDSMPSILVGVDAKAAVTLWNKHAENATGLSFEEATGKPVNDLFPEFSKELTSVATTIHKNRPQFFEKIRRPRNGETEYVDVLIYPLKLENKVGAVVRMDNVTQRVKMEQMMIQTEKIVSVGGMAAGMAHEINNPLGVIMMAIQNIDRRLSPDHSANIEAAGRHQIDLTNLQHYLEERKIGNLLDSMKASISRASEIISNMLHYSRSSESKMAPNDLNKICDHAIQLASNDFDLKKKYDFRKIEIIREYDLTLELISCTETEIEQVILNLLKNAAQAMSDNDDSKQQTIRIKTGTEEQFARIEVEDTGPGLDEATRNRVFEPFFTTKPPGIGTGLGLSVSYMIVVNNHQGTFEVESRVGQGCKFIVSLPISRVVSQHNP